MLGNPWLDIEEWRADFAERLKSKKLRGEWRRYMAMNRRANFEYQRDINAENRLDRIHERRRSPGVSPDSIAA